LMLRSGSRFGCLWVIAYRDSIPFSQSSVVFSCAASYRQPNIPLKRSHFVPFEATRSTMSPLSSILTHWTGRWPAWRTGSPRRNKVYFSRAFLCTPELSITDLVISLDDVWEWMGFHNKGTAKEMRWSEFPGGDRLQSALSKEKRFQYSSNGGHNQTSVMMGVEPSKNCSYFPRTDKARKDCANFFIVKSFVAGHVSDVRFCNSR
jgi:hypothetical protein